MTQQSASVQLSQISEATDWCSNARRILAYPEDLGMARWRLRSLRHLLAAREGATSNRSLSTKERSTT